MPPWPSLNDNNATTTTTSTNQTHYHHINSSSSFPHLHLIGTAATVFALFISSALSHREPCPEKYWLNASVCSECSVCTAQSAIVLRPCQPHKDTVCGTIDDLEIDWNWLAHTENLVAANWKEVRVRRHFSNAQITKSDNLI